MASNNSKYTPEYRKEICQLIISSGRSATSIAEEMGIDKNTVCSWMRDYRKQNQLPTYAEEKGIQRSVREEDAELKRKNKEKELEIQRLKKESNRKEYRYAALTIMHAWRVFLPQQKKN